jgi:diacylglycerol kinase
MIDLPRTVRSFRFAFKGVRQIFKDENNARVHLLATITVTIAGIIYHISRSEWLWVIFAIFLVWITEVINTAIERLVDLAHPGLDARAGAIKDLAAAAVLFAAIASVLIGGIVFAPYLMGGRP